MRALQGLVQYVALDAAHRAAPADHLLAERDTQPATPPPPVELTWDSPWVICYTGGTTGLPKGRDPDPRQRHLELDQHGDELGLSPQDRTILNMPSFTPAG